MLRQLMPAMLMVIATQAIAFQNEPGGFRGILWGAEITGYSSEMIVVQEKGNTIIYRRNDDKRTIGDAELNSLLYVFYKGRLSSVMMSTQGIENRRRIKDAFEAQFGPPVRPNRFMEEFTWTGPVSRISLDCTSPADRCHAFIFSREMLLRERADAKASAAEKVQKDF